MYMNKTKKCEGSMGQGSAMEQGYAGCFKGVGGVFFFSSGVVSGIVQYTIFLFCVVG